MFSTLLLTLLVIASSTTQISNVSVGSLSATPHGDGSDVDEAFDLEIYGLGARVATSVGVSFASSICEVLFGGNHRQTIMLNPRMRAIEDVEDDIAVNKLVSCVVFLFVFSGSCTLSF